MMRTLICLILLMFSIESYAQTACPQGVGPGDPRCGPGGSGGGGWDLPAGKIYTRWKATWGALVADAVTGNVGTSTGQFSRRRATREAVAKCRSMGGSECGFTFTYTNSCVAVAEVNETLKAPVVAYQTGATIDEASKVALDVCSTKNGGRECRVNYTKCTAPVLIRE